MRNLSDLVFDDSALSGIVGEILLTGIAVLAFAIIAVSAFSMLDPVENPHIDVDGWPNNYTDKIHIRHTGGEILDTDDLKLMVKVNDTRKSYTSSDIKDKFYSKDTWGLSDTISVNVSEEFGQQVTSDKNIEFTLVHTKSSVVIENGILAVEKDDGDGNGDGDGGNGNGDGAGDARGRVEYVDESVYRSGNKNKTLGFEFNVTEGNVTISYIEVDEEGKKNPIINGSEDSDYKIKIDNVEINSKDKWPVNDVEGNNNEFYIESSSNLNEIPTKDLSVKFIFGDGSDKSFDYWQ